MGPGIRSPLAPCQVRSYEQVTAEMPAVARLTTCLTLIVSVGHALIALGGMLSRLWLGSLWRGRVG